MTIRCVNQNNNGHLILKLIYKKTNKQLLIKFNICLFAYGNVFTAGALCLLS